jgi:hypothetical protein
MSAYNATVYRIDPATGEERGVFVAEVDAEGRMLRSNWLQCTGLEGTARRATAAGCSAWPCPRRT